MFDSLLAKLKCDVSNVSAVQASDSKAFARNGSATADVSGVSETRLRAEPDTADTACNGTDVSPEPAPIGACTSDTADTAEKATRQADALKVGADDTAPTPADARIQKVTDRLDVDPGQRYSIEAHHDTEPENVILTLAIRGKGTCELHIPKSRYDAFALLELIEKHTTIAKLQ